MPKKSLASTAAKTRTKSRSPARASRLSTSIRKPAALTGSSSENHSTFQRPPQPLNAWPGHGADDDDPDDYEDDGTEDLPGALEPRQSRRTRKGECEND